LLVSWYEGGRCGMASSDEDHGKSMRSGVEHRGWLGTCRILGGRTIGKSGDAVCDLHCAQGDGEREFLG
jgi:hypothetical protein